MSDGIGPVEDLGWVPLSSIDPAPWNPNKFAEVDFDGLVENIKVYGFRGAVLLRDHPNNSDFPYQIVDGEHRTKALGVIWSLPREQMPSWATDGMIGKVPAIKQHMPDAHAKLSTLSMNILRGQHDPIQEAKLLVQITQEIGDSDTLRLLGMRQIELDTSIALLEAPETPPLATSGEEESPVNVTITLMPGQAMSYEQALEKAMAAMPEDDTLVLVKERADAYDEAMRKAIRIGNIQKRGDAFWQICQWFLEADDDTIKQRFPPPEKKKKEKK